MSRRPVNAPYSISSEFGVPDSRAKFGYHAGVDYAIPTGRDILAPIAGTVTDYRWGTYHGNVIQIFDGQFYHRLMHNSALIAPVGSKVSEGQVVAKSGATGQGITGPHVHWDISREKFPSSFASFISPAEWLAGKYNAPVVQPPSGGGKIMDTDAKVAAQYFTLRGNPGTAAERAGWVGKSYDEFNAKAKAEAVNRAQQIIDLTNKVKTLTAAGGVQKVTPTEVEALAKQAEALAATIRKSDD